MDKIDIKSLNIKNGKPYRKLGDKKFRSKQIFDWLHVKLVDQLMR